jgi:hypothetical protein
MDALFDETDIIANAEKEKIIDFAKELAKEKGTRF